MVPKGWRIRPFGDFLTESRLPGSTGVDARKLTLKLYGLGVVPKSDRRPGSGNTKYYRRLAGQFLYSKLDFLNGAFGVVPQDLDGWETTLDLPAFDVSADVDPRWLVSYVTRESFYKGQRGRARGGRKARRVPPGEFLSIQILTPTLPEQKKIAEILGSVDEAIQATQAVIDQTRKVKQGLLQQLLTRGIGHTRFKQTEIGEIPEEWEVSQIREVAHVVRGGSPRPAGDRRFFNGDYVPWITVKEVTRDGWVYLRATKTRLTEEGSTRSRLLRKGTVVLTNSGATLGVPKVLQLDGCANDGIAAFLDLSGAVDRLFFHYYLSTLTNWLRDVVAPGLGQPNLNTDLIGDIRMPIPPLAEQEQISHGVFQVDTKLNEDEMWERGLSALKRGLMQDLLTGRVRVTTE